MGRVNSRKSGFVRLGRAGLVIAAVAASALAASVPGAAAAGTGTSDVITQPVVGQTWAGYDSIAAMTPASAADTYFTSVTGSFAAPALRCEAGGAARASVWVGLGGVLSTRAVYGPLQ
ncbi:MAG TPA: G1 family glutamic endopeptidase, partial [Solirubrobacteraceae bacterium]|nr:G1 family glutamic endopeptidase [Solirubrobacteraceae bacterium]